MTWGFDPKELESAVSEAVPGTPRSSPIDALDAEVAEMLDGSGWPGAPERSHDPLGGDDPGGDAPEAPAGAHGPGGWASPVVPGARPSASVSGEFYVPDSAVLSTDSGTSLPIAEVGEPGPRDESDLDPPPPLPTWGAAPGGDTLAHGAGDEGGVAGEADPGPGLGRAAPVFADPDEADEATDPGRPGHIEASGGAPDQDSGPDPTAPGAAARHGASAEVDSTAAMPNPGQASALGVDPLAVEGGLVAPDPSAPPSQGPGPEGRSMVAGELEIELSDAGAADAGPADLGADRPEPPASVVHLPRLVGEPAAPVGGEPAAPMGGESPPERAVVLPSLTRSESSQPPPAEAPAAPAPPAPEAGDERDTDGVPVHVTQVPSAELEEVEEDDEDDEVDEVDAEMELEEVEELPDASVSQGQAAGVETDPGVGTPGSEAPGASSEPPPRAPPAPTPPTPPTRKRGWFEEVFAEHYTSVEPITAPESAARDVDFLLERTGVAAPGRVLDVGCGAGHHAFALRDQGFEVTGVDSSLAMLLHASQANERRSDKVDFLHGDMRKLSRDAPFDLVTCLGTSFGYFDDDQNLQVLRELAAQLKPEGRLVMQVINRDHFVSKVPCRSWWNCGPAMVLDEADINVFRSTLKVHRTIVFEDGRQFEHHMVVRAYALHELGKLCSVAGLRVVEVSGSRDTPGRFFGATSPDIWLVAAHAAA